MGDPLVNSLDIAPKGLVVEDDQGVGSGLAGILAADGHEVRWAHGDRRVPDDRRPPPAAQPAHRSRTCPATRRHIGILYAYGNLLDHLTVAQNIVFARRLAARR